VLMTNHVHLLVTSSDTGSVSRMMQIIGRDYVRYVNTRYHRTGTLWEGRFRSSVIESERHLLLCHAYIELNPVRARIVETPDRYAWSSYCRNAFGAENVLITPHLRYDALGASDTSRQAAYRALFRHPLDEETLDLIRRATNRGVALRANQLSQRLGLGERTRLFSHISVPSAGVSPS